MMDYTQAQGSAELERAKELSLRHGHPPCEVTGYEARRFLGAGAYGEVWVAIDRNTGRQVAIKFYLHRGGLDWSLLSHEVETLAFLSADRYVVQLLDVGWEAEPPYFVMEYVDAGSLEERLRRQGRLDVGEAVSLFREIAVGLVHAHNKGILHCDLKPANVLLDQDSKPRLADFGQSRLSHEQTPALGTLFYMAPEQADLKAVPDARWDVYALGAILYSMLTGNPPHRHEKAVTEIENAPDLEERLARYRRLISKAPPATEHRKVAGVDHRLAEIIDRSLAVDPAARYPNVQAVLDALDARTLRRSRRPLVVLGLLGPILLLSVMSVFAWLWFNTSLKQSSDALIERAVEGLRFAAQSVATGAGKELEMRFRDVEEVAADPRLIELLTKLEDNPRLREILASLSDPQLSGETAGELVEQLGESEEVQALQSRFAKIVGSPWESWFIADPRGLQIARVPLSATRGRNYGWRTYFHGGPRDFPTDWRPSSAQHIEETQLSAVYRSQSTERWVVAISTPVYGRDENGERRFLGVVAMSFRVGEFVDMPETSTQFAVLVDAREGDRPGLILEHPLFNVAIEEEGQLPARFEQYRVPLDSLPSPKTGEANYWDPLREDESGRWYRQRFLAAQSPIEVRGNSTGWIVVVEDSYDRTIGGTLATLGNSLLISGLAALGLIAFVIVGLWWFVIRMLDEPGRGRQTIAAPLPVIAETLPARLGRGT